MSGTGKFSMVIFVVLLALWLSAKPVAAASCGPDANDGASVNEIFVAAVKQIREAENQKNPLGCLRSAMHQIERIVNEHPGTGLAVKLISGQQIGDISMPALETRLRTSEILYKTPDTCTCHKCACHKLHEGLLSAMNDIPSDSARDLLFASIARQQARARDYDGAFCTAKMIIGHDKKKKHRLLQSILRAKIRAALLEKTAKPCLASKLCNVC